MQTESKTLELLGRAELERHGKDADDVWVCAQKRKLYSVTRFLKENADVGADEREALLAHAGKDIDAVDGLQILSSDEYLVGYLATANEEEKLLTNRNHRVEVKLQGAQTGSANAGSAKAGAAGSSWDSTTFVKDLPTEDKLSIATDYRKDYEKHKFLDLERPLLPQLLTAKFNKDFYLDQIHRPRHYGHGSAPLFGNFLEPISKTAWWVVPLAWGPVVTYYFVKAASNINIFLTLFLFGLGIFVWTLIEYCLHRFLFHMDEYIPDHRFSFTIHFLLHGCHHYLPMDKYRLVVPPTLFVVLCAPFYKLVFALLPYYWACAGFAGGLLGYIGYDLTHYFLHHSRMPPFYRKLKKYHLEHHYKNYQLGFGVSNWFWDKVFGTYLGPDAPLSKMKYD